MYKVLLVDDEALTREAISENIKWAELGYELTGSCKDGREAMANIRNNPPELLLTDICMPYVDGMELTKFVFENYPDMRVIIISGYDEFEYAKKAVKYQVIEYILKPVTAFELSETLLKVREALDEQRLKDQNLKKIRGAYISNLPVMRGRFLNGLLQGKYMEEELPEKLKDYHVELKGRCYVTAMVQPDDLKGFLGRSREWKSDLALFAIFNIAEEIVQHFEQDCTDITFQDIADNTIIIFAGESESRLEKKVMNVCEQIQRAVNNYIQIETTIGIGDVVYRVNKLHLSFEGTKSVLEYKFLLGGKQIFYARNFTRLKDNAVVDTVFWTNLVVLGIKTNNQEDIENSIQGYMESIRNAYVSKNRSIIYVNNLILSIMNALDTTGISDVSIFDKERELLNNIYGHDHLSEAAGDLIRFCREISEFMADQKDSYCKKQAILALDYIDKNYGDSEISLNSVCSHLAMSTSYFSSVFKNYTGETFIESLTKKRMEKAKILIGNTSMKTYEIAADVGYSDPHYFSVTFKKFMGITPTEYAKLNK